MYTVGPALKLERKYNFHLGAAMRKVFTFYNKTITLSYWMLNFGFLEKLKFWSQYSVILLT